MEAIRLTEAIQRYNRMRSKETPKMTQQRLANLVVPDRDRSEDEHPGNEAGRKLYYINRWCKGDHYGKMTPEVVVKICEVLGVDANFLFNIKPMKNDD